MPHDQLSTQDIESVRVAIILIIAGVTIFWRKIFPAILAILAIAAIIGLLELIRDIR